MVTDRHIDSLEFETLLFGRYSMATRKGIPGRLERSAYTLLSRLSMGGQMSIGQLSDALGLDASTLNRQTGSMMRQGLLARVPDPDGGIARQFRLTAEGERTLEAERGEGIRNLREILADWEDADIEALAGYLRRFNSDIERRHGNPWPRRSASRPAR